MQPRRVIPLLLLLVILVAGYLVMNTAKEEEAPSLTASGTVETVEVVAAAEQPGRITEVLVEEGAPVSAGDVLFTLDDESLRIQRELALATGELAVAVAREEVIAAQQALDDLHGDAPVMAAQAQQEVAQLRDQLEDAEYKWRVQQEGYRANGETIAAAEANLVLAEEEVDDAEAAYNKVSSRASNDPARALARSNLAAARQHRDDILRRLNWYRGHPDEVDQAMLDADVAIAEAQLREADSRYKKLRDGPDPDAVAMAEAHLATARAGLRAAQVQLRANLRDIDLELEKLVIRSPATGVVLVRSVEEGELVQAGAPAFTIGRLDELTLTVYVPEDRYGQIRLGQRAAVTVDSFPGEIYEAVVKRIADQAQFTPTNVQTEEERVKLVFAIELLIEDPTGKLKPGMPASAAFSS